ncbi:MAG: hypothetical protein ACRD5Z_10680, partial [Bryobacteraceae bacterium]
MSALYIRIIAVVAAYVIPLAETVAADSTNYLINSPVSMMDWGSQKAGQAAQRAVDALNVRLEARDKQDFDFKFDNIPEEVKRQTLEDRKRPGMSLQQYGFRYVAGYAGYDPPKDRILVGAFVTPHYSLHTGKIDVAACAGLMADFRESLLIYGATKDGVQQAAIVWFSHAGYDARDTPANFAADLSAHIATVLNLDDYPTIDPKVKCE